MWQEAYQKPSTEIPFSEMQRNQARILFEDTLNRMEISDNQGFKDASKKIKLLKTTQRLLFGLNDDLKTPADSGYTFYEQEQKDYFVLRVNPHFILNTSGLELAFVLTHEGEHLKNVANFVESLPINLSPREKVGLNTQRKGQENLSEEARGYGAASNAYVYEYGFFGGKGLVQNLSPEIKTDAYFFILTGSNPGGDAWRRYVNVNILSKSQR